MARFDPIPGQILGKVEKGPGREQKEPIVPFPGKFHNGLFKLCHEDAYKNRLLELNHHSP